MTSDREQPVVSASAGGSFRGFMVTATISILLLIGVQLVLRGLTPEPDIPSPREAPATAIPPEALVLDPTLEPLILAAQERRLDFLIAANNRPEVGGMSLFYRVTGTLAPHRVNLPLSTYLNLETSILLPLAAPLEAASDEFYLDNPALFSAPAARGKRRQLPLSQELFAAAGIGLTFALVYLVLAPLRRRSGSPLTDPPGPHGAVGAGAVPPGTLAGSMDELVGLADVKAEVLQLEHMLKNRELYRAHGIDRPFNILLSGPAGTGKTKIVGYLAKSLNVPLYSKPAASLETGLIGGGSETLGKLYAEARKNPLSIVFLDEGQVLLARRGTDPTRKNADDTANTLLAILDGTAVEGQNQVITVVASNFNDASLEMDEAMLRRFPLKIDFRLPNLEERRDILRFYLEKKAPTLVAWEGINLGYLADITAGLSPALLNAITDKASLISIQEQRAIDTEVLFRAFERCTVGLTDRASTSGRDEERRRIAIHELGHFFLQIDPLIRAGLDWAAIKAKARLLKISTEAIAKVGALGYVLSSREEISLQTLDQLEQEVVELYGGAAAEEVFYGPRGISVGSSNDFDKATRLLDAVVNKLSMYGHAKLNYTLLQHRAPGADAALLEAKADELYARALAGVRAYRALIEQLTGLLLERYVLGKDEVFAWLETHAPPPPPPKNQAQSGPDTERRIQPAVGRSV